MRKNEEQYEELVEDSNSIIMKIDRNLTITYINDFGLRFFGYTAQELIGNNVIGTIMPKSDDTGRDLESMAKDIIKHPERYQSNIHKNMLKSGELVWVSWTNNVKYDRDGAVREILAIGNDISKLKKAEEALEAGNQRLTEVLESIKDDFYVLDSNWIFVYANRQFTSRIGKEPSDFVGNNIWDMFPRHRGTVFEENLRATMEKREIRRFEVGGKYTNAWYSMASFPSAEGITVLGTDITERKRAEEDLKAINREIESFSYSIAHDLRAPLRAIKGFSTILLMEYKGKLNTHGRDYLSRIDDGVDTMSRLIDDLLRLLKVSHWKINASTVDLHAIAVSVLKELRNAGPPRNVEIVVAENLSTYGDGELLNIALHNLIENAWKFTAATIHPRIEVGEMKREGERVFFIKDNGAGFDMQYADKLFSPFQRLHTEPRFSGTGIGLAITKRIIQRHGGSIWAEGKPGHGAQFFFTLPESIDPGRPQRD